MKAILGPLAGQQVQDAAGKISFRIPEQPLPRIDGDCDEAATLCAAGPAALGIPTCFRFGGHQDAQGAASYHHVWACAFIGDLVNPRTQDFWWDMDATIPSFRVGDFAPFGRYGKRMIFGNPEA